MKRWLLLSAASPLPGVSTMRAQSEIDCLKRPDVAAVEVGARAGRKFFKLRYTRALGTYDLQSNVQATQQMFEFVVTFGR